MIDQQQIKKSVFETGRLLKKAIMYMIDSKSRTSINIAQFLKTQLLAYQDELITVRDKQKFMSYRTKDTRALAILRYVHNNFKYVSDKTNYNSVEHWSSIEESLSSKKGDCEDGAILIYCLMRVSGFTEYDVQLIAGNVAVPGKAEYAGHCWVNYVSDKYPTANYFLDWCFYPDETLIRQNRNWYQLEDGKIEDMYYSSSKYNSYWFLATDKDGWH